MTDPTQAVNVRRIYYASGTPPVPPVLYDNAYDSQPNVDVLDAVLEYNGQISVEGYVWNGVQQSPNNVAPQLVSLEVGAVNGFTIVATFDTDVVASNYATGWTYKVNGVSTPITSAARQGNHAIVRFVVPIPWHGSIDDLTLEYDSDAGDYASESNDIVLATIDVQIITNNITWAALLDLQADTGVITSVAPFAGTGTAAQAVNTLTGVGTAFLSEVVIGDVITGTGINGTVTAIASDTSLTLSSSATAGAVAYTITPQAASARVTTWTDQSINDNDFTQSGTSRPSKQTISAYPAIVLDGANDWLLGGNFADNLRSFAVFSVLRRAVIETFMIVIGKGTAGSGSPPGWIIKVTYTNFVQFEAQNLNYTDALFGELTGGLDTKCVLSYSQLNLLGTMRINSDDLDWYFVPSAGELNYGTSDNVQIGKRSSDSAACPSEFYSFLICQINDVAGWDTDRAALETRLGARYGLTIP